MKPSWESGHLACRSRVPVSPTALALQRFQASKPAPDASEQVRRRACTPSDMLALYMQMLTEDRCIFNQHEASTHVCFMQATGNYLRGSASSGKGPVTYMVSHLSRVPFMDSSTPGLHLCLPFAHVSRALIHVGYIAVKCLSWRHDTLMPGWHVCFLFVHLTMGSRPGILGCFFMES